MQEFLVAICIGLALYWVWRNLVGTLGNKHRCCGCHGCENRPTCDPAKQAKSQLKELQIKAKGRA